MPRTTRPVWEGHLRLSLVTCPVALFKATSESGGVHFHLLHPKSHNRVKQAWKDPGLPAAEQEVARADLLHGYEVEKGRYVVIEDEDIRAIRLESTKTLQIERFVDAGAIDRVFWDEPYYLVPTGRAELVEPFAVIRDAMAGAGRVALGRVVMTGRERTVALEVRERGMLLTTLHAFEEVRDAGALFDAIPAVKPAREMVEIAEAIIGKQEGAFEPSAFHDRYADALRKLVEEKSGSATVVAEPEAAAESNVVDLMEALRRSLGAVPGTGPAPEGKAKARRRAGKK